MSEWSEALMQQAIAKWGTRTQLDMVIEECAELIDAIQKKHRGRVGFDKVLEEGVDVELCLEQLKLILNTPNLWQQVRCKKLKRLAGLLRLE